jgi:hypothetical protein
MKTKNEEMEAEGRGLSVGTLPPVVSSTSSIAVDKDYIVLIGPIMDPIWTTPTVCLKIHRHQSEESWRINFMEIFESNTSYSLYMAPRQL